MWATKFGGRLLRTQCRNVHVVPVKIVIDDARRRFRANIGDESIYDDPIIQDVCLKYCVGSFESVEYKRSRKFVVDGSGNSWHLNGRDCYGKDVHCDVVVGMVDRKDITFEDRLLHLGIGNEFAAEIVDGVSDFVGPGYREEMKCVDDDVIAKMEDIIRSEVCKFIGEDIKMMDMSVIGLKAYVCDLPVYVCWYRVGGLWYYKIINRQTGRISEGMTSNVWGHFCFGGVIGGIFGLGIAAVNWSVSIVSVVPPCVVFVACVFALFAVIGNKCAHYCYVAKYQSQLDMILGKTRK